MSKLAAENISKSFQNGKGVNQVLNDINFSVKEGDFVSLLGPSGCGKTTLLTIMAGFQKADSGIVYIDGKPVDKPGSERAFVFQNYALFPWMTMKQNIMYPMKRQKISKKEREKTLKRLLYMAQLEGKENLFPHQLSGGMKQRTAVIRALASNPKVLLMDEPLGAVDYQMRRDLQKQMEKMFMQNNSTVLMVSHSIEEAVFLSDRVFLMSTNKGKIIEDLYVDLPRPRDRNNKKYSAYKEHLTDLIEKAKDSDVENNKLSQKEVIVSGKAAAAEV